MRILTIPSWYPSDDRPFVGLFVREQVQCLARGLDVTVLTPRFPSLRDQCRLRWGPEFICEEENGLRTWQVRYLKAPTLRRFIPFMAGDSELVYYRKFAAAIRRGFSHFVARHGRPEVIHAHVVFPAGWIAVELGEALGIPVVLTEHSPIAMHVQTPVQRGLVRDILHRCDRVIAVSPTLRDAMLDFCPDLRIDVVGNLIDTDYFTMGRPAPGAVKTFRFFFLGIHVEVKGLPYLFQAVHALVQRGFGEFEVHLGGDGPLGPSLEKMALHLGIADRVRFLGMLDRAAVREQMQACDVFVLPSLAETFGIVNGEAMACGKPVISTRCGGPEYVVTPESGVLVAPGNPQELADAMASFLKRDRTFDPLRIRASIVQRFGPRAFLEQSAAIYADVADHFNEHVDPLRSARQISSAR